MSADISQAGAQPAELTRVVRGGWRPPLVFVVALCAVAPMLAIALLATWRADQLAPLVSVELSTLQATQRLLATLFHPSTYGDSWLPMQQALQVLKSPRHNQLYETLFFQGHVRFQYPPTSLLWLEALSALGRGGVFSLNALNSLVFLTNAAATGLAAWLFLRQASAVSPASRASLSLLAAAVAFLFYPLVRAHLLGQIQLWIDLAFTGAVVLWALDRRLLAGALIGLACTIKPQIGLLLLWGLLWREGRFVGGALLTLIPLGAVSLLRYGLHNHLAYLGVLSFLSHHGESFFANNSVNGLLNWYLAGENSLRWNDAAFPPYRPLVYLGTVCASLVFLVAIVAPPLLARRHKGAGRKADLSDLAGAAICTVAGSPVAWEHHYGLLLPLFVLALTQLLTQPAGVGRNWRAVILLVAWTLTANFIPFASLAAGTPFAALQAYCFFGALLLLALFLARRVARAPVPAEP